MKSKDTKFSYWLAYVVYRRRKKGFARMLNRMAWANVSLGLAAVLLAIFVLRGFRQEVSDKLHTFMGHIQVRPYVIPGMSREALLDLREGVYAAYLAKEIEGIKFIQPYAYQAALLKSPERVMGIQFKGISSPYSHPKGLLGLKKGRMLDLQSPHYAKECILSQKMAEELQLSIGDSILVHFLKQPPQYRRLKVVGWYRTALEEVDAKVVLGDLRLLQQLHAWEETSAEGLEVFLFSVNETEKYRDLLFEKVDYGLEVVSTAEDYPQIFGWFNILDKNTYIFLCLMIGVASFNMLALCMIWMMERKQMIATLCALGATQGWIRRLLFSHSLLWIIWGMMWGNAIAFVITFLEEKYHLMKLDAENYAVDYVPMHIEWPLWLATNVGFLLWLALALRIALGVMMRRRSLRASLIR